MIKKGDKFRCIKDVIMDDDPDDIAYHAGNIYISEEDGCVTDNDGNTSHIWDTFDNMEDYFIKLSEDTESQKENVNSISESCIVYNKNEKTMNEDMVNHPEHYYNGKFECIEVMLDVFDKDKVANFCELNAFKYLWRADNKGTDIQDKKKAIWYLNKYIELKGEV